MKSKYWLIALLVCLVMAILSPLASSSPDGLERVAEDKGFIGLEVSSQFQLFADYLLPGIENQTLAKILAGTIGTLILFVLAYGVAWLLVINAKRKKHVT